MSQILFRAAGDFDVSSDGRNLEGIAFRWQHPSLVQDEPPLPTQPYFEEFARGSTNRTLAMRGLPRPLFVMHQHVRGSVGEVEFAPADEGLMFRARMSDTRFAASTLERVNAGELPAVSVGFYAKRSTRRSDRRGVVTVRQEIALQELSLADAEHALHEGARVLAVRSQAETPRLDALRKRKALLLL